MRLRVFMCSPKRKCQPVRGGPKSNEERPAAREEELRFPLWKKSRYEKDILLRSVLRVIIAVGLANCARDSLEARGVA